MVALTTELTRDWHVAVQKLDAAEVHASKAWTWLTKQAPLGLIGAVPELQTQYNGLHARGRMIEGTVRTVRGGINQAMAAVKGAYHSVVNFATGLFGLEELGLVGLISAAAILGAVAAMTYWVTEVIAFRQKVAAIQQLVHEGMTPAAAAAQFAAHPGLLGQAATAAKSLAVLLGVGTVALFAYHYWQRRAQ
jgi:hypothetical protein